MRILNIISNWINKTDYRENQARHIMETHINKTLNYNEIDEATNLKQLLLLCYWIINDNNSNSQTHTTHTHIYTRT